jgi:hypothetical protein
MSRAEPRDRSVIRRPLTGPDWLQQLGLSPGLAAALHREFMRARRARRSIREVVLDHNARRIALAMVEGSAA